MLPINIRNIYIERCQILWDKLLISTLPVNNCHLISVWRFNDFLNYSTLHAKQRIHSIHYLPIMIIMEHEGNGDTNSNLCTQKTHKCLVKGTGRFKDQRTSEDHPVYSIIKIRKNTEKSPWDLRWLAVTRTPVKNNSLTLVWKTLKVSSDHPNYSILRRVPEFWGDLLSLRLQWKTIS